MAGQGILLMPTAEAGKSGRKVSAVDEAARYRILVEAVTDYAIYMLDPEGVVTSWNAGAQRFKGYTAEEIIGQNFARFYTDEDRARGLPARALAISAREGKFEGEGWRVRKDGSRFWAHVVIDPIRTSEASFIGFAKITRDLTERRQAEEALRRSQEHSGFWSRASPIMPSTCSAPTASSPTGISGAQRIKGYAPEEIIGQHFSQFYTEEDRARGLPGRALETAAREGRFESEGWRVRKDGSRFWAHVVIDPIRALRRQASRLRQDHPRHHRAQGRAGFAGAGARGAVPVAEDGSGRPADRRGGARLQQSADGGAGQPGTPAQAPARRSAADAAAGQCHPGRQARRHAHPAHAGLRPPPGPRAQPLDLSALVHGMGDLLERSLGIDVANRDGVSRLLCRGSWPTRTSSSWRCSTSASTPATP